MTKQKPRYWILAVLALFPLAVFGPLVAYRTEYAWFCPFCRARKTQTVSLGIHLAPVLYEDQASKYWMEAIDSKHRHVWVLSDTYEHFPLGRSCGCGYSDAERLMLSPKAEIAILRSLGPCKQRKSLIDRLLVWNLDNPESVVEWRLQAFQQLAANYRKNPHRKDWPNQLEKLGIKE